MSRLISEPETPQVENMDSEVDPKEIGLFIRASNSNERMSTFKESPRQFGDLAMMQLPNLVATENTASRGSMLSGQS